MGKTKRSSPQLLKRTERLGDLFNERRRTPQEVPCGNEKQVQWLLETCLGRGNYIALREKMKKKKTQPPKKNEHHGL